MMAGSENNPGTSSTGGIRVMGIPHVTAPRFVAYGACLLVTMANVPCALAVEAPAAAQAASDVSSEYLIGPGDTLEIFVWRNPELTATVPVRPDGKVSTPLVENMVAVGKTPSQLARDIEKMLSEYVKSPEVNVIVTV